MAPTEFDPSVFIIALAAVILFALLFALASFLNDFSMELRLLKCEIRRSSGEERRYWIRKRRRLWLSLLPFIKY